MIYVVLLGCYAVYLSYIGMTVKVSLKGLNGYIALSLRLSVVMCRMLICCLMYISSKIEKLSFIFPIYHFFDFFLLMLQLLFPLQLILNKVLMLGSASQTIVGRPIVPEAAVHAVVEEHVSSPNLSPSVCLLSCFCLSCIILGEKGLYDFLTRVILFTIIHSIGKLFW